MADIKDKYLETASGQEANGGGTTPVNNENYYKLAREQEYATLLDKDIQLENAKANAMKYAQNQINANGFGGTGYGSSMNAGVINSYMNRVNEAERDYNTRIKQINVDERNAIEEQFQQKLAMIQGANDYDSVNQMLKNYGYGSIDDKGNFVWGDKPEGMSDNDWNTLKYYYSNRRGELTDAKEAEWAKNNTMNGQGFADAGSFQGKTSIGKDIQSSDGVQYELRAIYNDEVMANVQEGDTIKLINSYNDNNFIYVIYHNGRWYQTTSKVYENSTNKGAISLRNENDYKSVTYNKIFGKNAKENVEKENEEERKKREYRENRPVIL